MIPPDNLLERAFMARLRADEYRAELKALEKEFDERPDVIEIKRLIDRCEEERRQCIAHGGAAQADAANPPGRIAVEQRLGIGGQMRAGESAETEMADAGSELVVCEGRSRDRGG